MSERYIATVTKTAEPRYRLRPLDWAVCLAGIVVATTTQRALDDIWNRHVATLVCAVGYGLALGGWVFWRARRGALELR